MDILPDDAPAPRLCHLIKWPDFDGYGFNLHAERSNPGQFIGKIDENSPAQAAGLREGDRIVEVNGVNINNENHRQVVERIKSLPSETKLLVVDPETDLWYKEQDLIIKSNQANVVYSKTPVPRPAPQNQAQQLATNPSSEQSSIVTSGTSMQQSLSPSTIGTSSLATSDFNDDSIEHESAEARKLLSDQSQAMQSPPMSPDSGKGDEELPMLTAASETANPVGSREDVVTIRAEINRQSPQKMLNSGSDATDEAIITKNNKSKIMKEILEKGKRQDDEDIQPDSLSDSQVGIEMKNSKRRAAEDSFETEDEAILVATCKSNAQLVSPSRAEELDRKVHNGSADSGQSSSPDTSSSGRSSHGDDNNSMTDSLEQQQRPSATVKSPNNSQQQEAASKTPSLDEEARATIKNYQLGTGETNDNNNYQTEADNGAKPAVDGFQVAEQQAGTKPLKSALTNNNHESKPQKLANSSQAQAGASPATNSLANNFSGLNLNMTASEMRELLARRKKFDPKKAQMNIRQKYEIIQQM